MNWVAQVWELNPLPLAGDQHARPLDQRQVLLDLLWYALACVAYKGRYGKVAGAWQVAAGRRGSPSSELQNKGLLEPALGACLGTRGSQ
jgi:hypothetical protein